MKKTIYIGILVVVVGILVWYSQQDQEDLQVSIIDFETCAQAGNPVMESYPRQCRVPDGRVFVEQVSVDKSDLVVVDSPKSGDIVTSPFTVKGKARGVWYFEASFPVYLVFEDTIIATGIAQAQGDWMTENFVPFEARLEFSEFIQRVQCKGDSCTVGATLVLKKDNPSGLPEHDDSMSIPVVLVSGGAPVTATCKPTGCSGQVCSDEDVITTCEYREEYACYQKAKCERQPSGQCGWTKTLEYSQCLTEGIELGPEPDLPL